ncbi:MAG: DUF4147 domain-containing protein [Pseudomonadota bacterium]
MQDNLREIARTCFDAGVRAADPYRAVADILSDRPEPRCKRLIFVALGKAAVPMMRAALHWQTPDQAVLVTNPENAAEIDGFTCLVGDHPVPSARGELAAAEVEKLLHQAGKDDDILLLLSGGASALVPAPKPPLTLADKMFINEQMLKAEMPIEHINTVRRSLSRIKGGGFLKMAAPAKVEALILSDVPSNDPRFIASGPTLPRTSDEDAAQILRDYGLYDSLASQMQRALAEPIDLDVPAGHNHIIGSNSKSVRAMMAAAPKGYKTRIKSKPITGNVEEVASYFADLVSKAPTDAAMYLSGGEPTVDVTGDGLGGRNQELALRVANLLDGVDRPWVFLSGGTDGRDGPTDAAGAIVDNGSLDRITSSSLDLQSELENNNSFAVLEASGDLLTTGGTGTNVADLHVLILGPANS